MPTSTPPTRSTAFSRRARPSCCSAWWRWRRSPPRCCTGRRSRRSASSAPMSRRCWSPRSEPNYWALYIYLAVVTAAAFALARFRHVALARASRRSPSACCGPCPASGVVSVDALGAHVFHVIVGFALAATLIVAGLWYGPTRVARPHRRRVIGGARRLPPRRQPAGAGEPARSARARDLRRARGGDGRDRLARGSGGRGRAGGGGARRAGVRALGRRSQHRAPACAVRVRWPARCPSRRKRNVGWHLVLGSGLCGAVRRRRLSGAGTLGARDRADPVERRGGVRADRDSGRALLPHRRVRALDPVRGAPRCCSRALYALADRDARQTRAASGPCRGERDLRNRRGRRARARAHVGAGERLAHGRTRADGAGHRLGLGQAAVAGAALCSPP